MRDLKRYWQEIRTLEKSLPEFVWLASGEKGGESPAEVSVVEVPANGAAQLLHARSHRLASEDEIRLHREREESSKARMVTNELKRQGVAVVAIQP